MYKKLETPMKNSQI